MHRKNVHRGIAALALTSMLLLAGAQPAAAANLGFLDRLASLWTAVTEREPAVGLWDTLAGWLGSATKKDSDATPVTDRGAGLDPLGTCAQSGSGDSVVSGSSSK
jgi:hypothetical protein